MPKTRSVLTEQGIQSAAWRLFLEKGYSATSYTDIARRSGISRPLVQRYVPKKGLLIERCVDAIREAATHVCDETYPDVTTPLARLYLLGQIDIATYFVTDGIRRIMLDVLSSRELTQQTIAQGFRWSVAKVLPERTDLVLDNDPDELIMAVGGLYELVYAYLAQGKTPDTARIVLPGVRTYGKLFSVPEPAEGLEHYSLPPDRITLLATRAVGYITW